MSEMFENKNTLKTVNMLAVSEWVSREGDERCWVLGISPG